MRGGSKLYFFKNNFLISLFFFSTRFLSVLHREVGISIPTISKCNINGYVIRATRYSILREMCKC